MISPSSLTPPFFLRLDKQRHACTLFSFPVIPPLSGGSQQFEQSERWLTDARVSVAAMLLLASF